MHPSLTLPALKEIVAPFGKLRTPFLIERFRLSLTILNRVGALPSKVVAYVDERLQRSKSCLLVLHKRC